MPLPSQTQPLTTAREQFDGCKTYKLKGTENNNKTYLTMLVRYSLLSILFIYLFWCADAATQAYSTAGPVTDSDFDIIRINFDYRYLDDNADAGYACYSAGQSVDLGTSNYTCTAADVITTTKRNNTIQILEAINNYFATRVELKTVRVNGNLALDPGPTTCGYGAGAPIPASYKSSGVPATDLLYVASLYNITL